MTGPGPELAVVVLSVGAPPELRKALQSLARQTVPVEVVVVNSGGGDPRPMFRDNDLEARIVSVPERLWPGAARNIGIRMSRAPWIAFMASDHVIRSDWAAARLEFHRHGHRAVACAVVNSNPRNLYACAYHCATLARRLPGIPRRYASLHGVSYSRTLFEQHGEFREDLRVGEDTEFNNRLTDEDHPLWAPSIQSVHLNPTTFRHMVRSQYHRGRRSGIHWPHWHQGPFLARMLTRFSMTIWYAYRATRGPERYLLVASWPLVLVCTWAYSLGVTAGRRELSKGERPPQIQRTASGSGTVEQFSLAGDLIRSSADRAQDNRAHPRRTTTRGDTRTSRHSRT